jgi:hypothetical protein
MIAEAAHNFERTLKFTLNLYDNADENSDEATVEVPLPGAPDIPAINLQDGYLTIPRYCFLRNRRLMF